MMQTDREADVEPQAGARFLEIDALRGIAALCVLAFHYLVRYAEQAPGGIPIPRVARFGEYGVELFFVISGFVIYLTVERLPSVRRFAVARFARLYPVYAVAALATFAVTSIIPDRSPASLPVAAQNLTMIQGFFQVRYLDAAYWSLTVELAFYVVIAVLLALKKVQHALLVLVVIALANTAVNAADRKVDLGTFLLWTEGHVRFLRYAGLFAAGVAFYELFVQGRRTPLIALALVLAPVAELVDNGRENAMVVLVIVVTFALVLQFRPRVLRWSVLLFLGEISYALYITHAEIGYASMQTLERAGLNHWISLALTVALAIGIAWVLTAVVERPSRRWLRAKLASKTGQNADGESVTPSS